MHLGNFSNERTMFFLLGPCVKTSGNTMAWRQRSPKMHYLSLCWKSSNSHVFLRLMAFKMGPRSEYIWRLSIRLCSDTTYTCGGGGRGVAKRRGVSTANKRQRRRRRNIIRDDQIYTYDTRRMCKTRAIFLDSERNEGRVGLTTACLPPPPSRLRTTYFYRISSSRPV